MDWGWIFVFVALFLWSNLCADAQQRQLFVSHYGKFSGLNYGTQQVFYASALLVYMASSAFGYQTNVSWAFEVLSLLCFAATELLFWVKQSFRWAVILQLSAATQLLFGIVYECLIGLQGWHYKFVYSIGRTPLLLYFLFYLVSVQSYQILVDQKPKLYREQGRFTDFNCAHVNVNDIFAPKIPILTPVVHKTALFAKPQ
jgi:hypothetical protein